MKVDGHKWCIDSLGYMTANINNDTIRLHRYLYEKYIGKIPDGYYVHHKDFNKLNNDISNLICVTPSEHSLIHKNRLGKNHNKETKRKLSEKIKMQFANGRIHPSLGKHPSSQTRIKMSISASKRIRIPFSEETKKKMSSSAKKRGMSEKTRQGAKLYWAKRRVEKCVANLT